MWTLLLRERESTRDNLSSIREQSVAIVPIFIFRSYLIFRLILYMIMIRVLREMFSFWIMDRFRMLKMGYLNTGGILGMGILLWLNIQLIFMRVQASGR